MKKNGVLALVALFAATTAIASTDDISLTLQATKIPLSDQESAQLSHTLSQLSYYLPAHFSARLPHLKLSISDSLPDKTQARLQNSTLILARHLLAENQSHARLAALVHELAHAFDNKTGLSREPRFLDISGWQRRPLLRSFRQRHTAMRDRSPDAYELTSPKEFFAVNVEYFLLDAQYACRRPALFRYFSEQLGLPKQPASCSKDFHVLSSTANYALESLQTARVYGVDYLLADTGDSLSSRWGHSMLRLIICAPETAFGPDCRFDLEYHRVLSFRAFVDDIQISSWAGLSGKYPSRLFVLPLTQVLEEYNEIELRDVISLPLRFKREEIHSLIEQAVQRHWNYDGRYTFFGNNCASALVALLQSGVPRLQHTDISTISPKGLLRQLRRHDLVDIEALTHTEAESLGHYFPAANAHFDAMFDTITRHVSLPVKNAEAWLKRPAARRQHWRNSDQIQAIAAFSVLEHAALKRIQSRIQKEIRKQLYRHSYTAEQQRSLFDETLASEALLSQPARLLHELAGYGLPQPDELIQAHERLKQQTQLWQQHQAAFRTLSEAYLSEKLRQELEATRRNHIQLNEKLRALIQRQTRPDDRH